MVGVGVHFAFALVGTSADWAGFEFFFPGTDVVRGTTLGLIEGVHNGGKLFLFDAGADAADRD